MTKHLIATGHKPPDAVAYTVAVMYRCCGWCKRSLDPPTVEVPDGSPTAGTTTHGICANCLAKLKQQIADKLEAKQP